MHDAAPHRKHRHVNRTESDGRDQVRDKDQLFNQFAGKLSASAGSDVADQLADERGDHGNGKHQLDRVPQAAPEELVPENAGFAFIDRRL